MNKSQHVNWLQFLLLGAVKVYIFTFLIKLKMILYSNRMTSVCIEKKVQAVAEKITFADDIQILRETSVSKQKLFHQIP